MMYGEYVNTTAVHYLSNWAHESEFTVRPKFLDALRRLHTDSTTIIMADNLSAVASILNSIKSREANLAFDARPSQLSQEQLDTEAKRFIFYVHSRMSGSDKERPGAYVESWGSVKWAKLFWDVDVKNARLNRLRFTACIFRAAVSWVVADDYETRPEHNATESVLLTSGLLIFEAIMRIEHATRGSEEKTATFLRSVKSMFDESLTVPTADATVSEWYMAMRYLAKDQIYVEDNLISIFDEIVLV